MEALADTIALLLSSSPDQSAWQKEGAKSELSITMGNILRPALVIPRDPAPPNSHTGLFDHSSTGVARLGSCCTLTGRAANPT